MRESLACLLIGLITGVALTLTQWPDTPPPPSELIVDDATGCHYIVGPTGGVTPRLAAPIYPALTGEHVCTAVDEGMAWPVGGEPWMGKDGEVVL